MTEEDEAFKAWWYIEGSQPPYTHHDCEEHCMRMCEIAWNEAVKAEREACAKLVEPTEEHRKEAQHYIGGEEGVELLDNRAATIRARGQA
jgi:hypothetical protein